MTDGFFEVFDDWKLSRQLLKQRATTTEEEQADMYIVGGIVRTLRGELELNVADALSGKVDPHSLSGRQSISNIERLALSTFLVSGFKTYQGEVQEAYVYEESKRVKQLPGWKHNSRELRFTATQRKLLVGRASMLFSTAGSSMNNTQRIAKADLLNELANNITPYADTLTQLYTYWGLNIQSSRLT